MLTNPFEQDAFNVYSLTRAINLLPNNYGRVREMGLMPVQGITTRNIVVEEFEGVLTLIPSQPVGSEGTPSQSGKRKVRSFHAPHLPLDDVLHPQDYQGLRAFGSEDMLVELNRILNDKLQTLKNKHAITLEHLRVGALKGVILDADASVLYDLFDEFGLTQETVNFELGTDDTDVRGKCFTVKRIIEDNLKGETMNGVHCLCGPNFMDSLTSHPEVIEAFKMQASNELREDVRKNFSYGGITFEEYRGKASAPDGSTRDFIGTDDAHFFPTGTQNSFGTVAAPADFMEAVNTRGRLFYAKQTPRKHNRGVDIHTQSNPLPLCYRPGILVKGNKTT